MRRIVVATDLSAGADRAADRAALLHLQDRASVELLHVVRDRAAIRRDGGGLGRLRGALSAVGRRLEESRALRGLGRVEIDVTVAAGAPFAAILRRVERAAPDLVVVGRHGGGGVRQLLIGSIAERVVRGRSCPVLIVSAAVEAPYARPLIAVDPFAPAGAQPLAAALRLLPGDLERVFVVSAYELVMEDYMRASGVSEAAIRRLRQRRAADAHGALAALLRERLPASAAATTIVQRGDACQIIHDAVSRRAADLVAVGSSARRGLGRLLIGSVATDVLRRAETDVLVVPHAAWRP